jgi:hypothetical protein
VNPVVNISAYFSEHFTNLVSGSQYSVVKDLLVNAPVFVAQYLLCLSKRNENFMGTRVNLLTEKCVENVSRAGMILFLKKSKTHIKFSDARNVT